MTHLNKNRNPKDKPIIRLPEKEGLLSRAAADKIKDLLGITDNDVYNKIHRIIYDESKEINQRYSHYEFKITIDNT